MQWLYISIHKDLIFISFHSPFSGTMSGVYITCFMLILIYFTKTVFIAHCHILFGYCSHHLLFRCRNVN